MKNKVDLTCCLVQDRKKRNRRERSVIIFWKDQNILRVRKLIDSFIYRINSIWNSCSFLFYFN
jgi:two-component SAPR family response regulator